MRRVIITIIIALGLLHQDFWWRYDHETLVFGFLPVSLAYHIALSIAASICWALACVYCWPRDLESGDQTHNGQPFQGPGH